MHATIMTSSLHLMAMHVIVACHPLYFAAYMLLHCITDYHTITIGQQKDVFTITSSFLYFTTNNYSDIHHGEITVNTKEDATEITIPWFNTNVIFLQCVIINPRRTCAARVSWILHLSAFILLYVMIVVNCWDCSSLFVLHCYGHCLP